MIKRMIVLSILSLAWPLMMAEAQVLKLNIGAAAFLDEDTPFDHFVIGGAYGLKLSDRLTLEPQFLYMRGPENDRDYVFLGNISYDVVEKGSLEVYVVAGSGFLHHTNQFGFGPGFSTTEWIANGGMGLRWHLSERFFIAPEFRVGNEPIILTTISLGYKF